MLQLDFSWRFYICTTAWHTYYKSGSFPDKTGNLDHMKRRRLVSKNGHPDTYVTTKYVDSEKLLESFPSISLFKN